MFMVSTQLMTALLLSISPSAMPWMGGHVTAWPPVKVKVVFGMKFCALPVMPDQELEL